MDYTKITNIDFADVFHQDSPDYSDAYIRSADYDNTSMTDDQLEEINNDRDFVYCKLIEIIYES